MDDLQDQHTLGTEAVTTWRTLGTLGTEVVTYQSRVVAYPIQIRWKQSDRQSATPTPATAASSATPNPVSSTTLTSTNTSAPKSSAESHPSATLSTGAKVGLGVGLGVSGLIVIGAFVWCCSRRRKTARGQRASAPANQVYSKAELDANAVIPPQGITPELWAPPNQVIPSSGLLLLPYVTRKYKGKG